MSLPLHISQQVRVPPDSYIAGLIEKFGARCSVAHSVREQHGRDESPFLAPPPDAVIYVESVEEVSWLAAYCDARRVPLIPHGAGSSLEGQLLAVCGGVSVDLTHMNRVVAVYPEDLMATVEAGVTRLQLNDGLRHTGLFFPVDPGADATLGGMAATRASGTNAVRYGTMRENVLSLTVVLANGRVVRTAHRARKSAAGYDLTHLFVGSEGTLGIIVEVTVKLYPRLETIAAAVCSFPDLESAVRSVTGVIQYGIPVARVEFMDVHAVRATNRYSHLTLRECPLLLFEFHGSTSSVHEHAEIVQQITSDNGGLDFDWVELEDDRRKLWKARHNIYFAASQLRPGSRSSATDVCVPISHLSECVEETDKELSAASFPYVIVGHVGDGNFHVQMMLDPDNEKEWAESERINRHLVERAIALDGTCTGEHGVGLHKRDYMPIEYGEEVLDVMYAVKAALDPSGILNPGKVLPSPNGSHAPE